MADLCDGMHEAYLKNGKRLPHGHVTKLLEELQSKQQWLSRNVINNAFMKCWHEKKKQVKLAPDTISGIGTSLSNLSDLSNVSDTTGTGIWKVGRPAGSTKTKKEKNTKEYDSGKK